MVTKRHKWSKVGHSNINQLWATHETSKPVSRYHASVIHLTASAAVAGIFLLLTFFVWYPAPLFKVEGAWLAIQILVAVNFIIGPLLTLMVFKPEKPGLKFDMVIIIAFQLSAFIYGANVIIKERPVIVSFAVDRFVVISAAEAKDLEMDRLDTQQVKLNVIGPSYVYAEQPDDIQAGQDLIFDVLDGKPDLERRPEYYRDFHANIERNYTKAIDLQAYAEEFEPARENIEKYFEKSGKSYADIAAYPVAGKHHDMVMVVDKQSKTLAGSIDINPWREF